MFQPRFKRFGRHFVSQLSLWERIRSLGASEPRLAVGRKRLQIESLERRELLSVTPAGPEVLLSLRTASGQSAPSIAMDSDGDFVAGWTSDGSLDAVTVQRFNAVGSPIGSEIVVATSTSTLQNFLGVQVAADSNGDFVVTWQGVDQSQGGISARLYNSAGIPQGSVFRANSYTTNNQLTPAVAMRSNGDFVITWYGVKGPDFEVSAQRYNAAGVPQGTEFAVNTTTTGHQQHPSIAIDNDGDFVVAWASPDGDSDGIFAQLFDAAGTKVGSEFRVNTTTTTAQASAAVATNSTGDFVVVWQGQNTGNSDIYAQRFNSAGVPQGTEFRVNSYTTDTQSTPTIASDATGNFTVAWSSRYQDGSGYGVYAQAYNAAGVPQSSEFRVNTFTTSDQGSAFGPPAAAMDSDGDLLIAWYSPRTGLNANTYGQFYNNRGDETPPRVLATRSDTSDIEPGGELVRFASSLTVLMSEQVSTAGGAAGANSILNLANWQLLRNSVDVTSQIGKLETSVSPVTGLLQVAVTFTQPPTSGSYQLTIRDEVLDLGGNPLDGNGDATPGGDYVLSFTVPTVAASGPEMLVNTTTLGQQNGPAVAMDSNGDYVVIWQGEDEDGFGVIGQRFNAAGSPVGSEFRVNTYTTGSQGGADVGMDSNGNFVVTWTSDHVNGNDVFAQRFSAAGAKLGSEFRVNAYTTSDQTTPAISLDDDGDFVIAWDDSRTGAFGTYFQRFNAAGVPQGAEVKASTGVNGVDDPSIALDSSGDFILAWRSSVQDGSVFGIYAARFNSAGVIQGSEFRVNSYTTGQQLNPSVAIDSDGDFVVAWDSDQPTGGKGVYFQRYNAAGVPQGTETRVHTGNEIAQIPAVTMDASGNFVVGFGTSSSGPMARKYDAAGVAQGNDFKVATITTSAVGARLAADDDGDFVVAWQSQHDGVQFGVFSQLYNTRGDEAPPRVLQVKSLGATIAPGGELVRFANELIVYFSEKVQTLGGAGGADSVLNPANWQLLRNSVDVSNRIGQLEATVDSSTGVFQVKASFTSALTPGVYQLTLRDEVEDPAGLALDGDNNATAGGDFVLTFTVPVQAASGPELLVNTYTTNDQASPVIAKDRDGDFIVVWDSYTGQDGDGHGIFAQRYQADGTRIGSEFRVNNYTTGNQSNPAVSVEPTGEFVIAWESNDGNSTGIYAQVFDSAGGRVGSEFRVNTYTTGVQHNPAVMTHAGRFVIAWDSANQDGDGEGVFAQRYNMAINGFAAGSEFQVNTTTIGNTGKPAIGMDLVDNFVITWSNESGGSTDIFAQRFDSLGVFLGSEFRVNTFTTGNQNTPSIAVRDDSTFVVAWSSTSNQDGSDYGVYAQRFTSSGSAMGSEFRVNTFTRGAQQRPSVRASGDGDFVVVWMSDEQDGSNGGVFGQHFNADGTRRGSEFQVNSTTASTQDLPGVALDDNGGFAVVWRGFDSTGWNVYLQPYLTDYGPRISTTSSSATEGADIVFTVSLNTPYTEDVLVAYQTSSISATEGDDYNGASSTLTIPAGQTQRTITIATTGDNVVELNESFQLRLSNPQGGYLPNHAATFDVTGTINDNDPATLSVVGNTSLESAGELVFEVKLSKPSDADAVFTYATSNGSATAGQDYTTASGTLTFTAGQTSKLITVAVSGDSVIEGNETLILTATITDRQDRDISTTPATGNGTITNDDTQTLTIGNVTIAEGNGGTQTMVFTVTSPSAVQGGFSVPFAVAAGTATSASDYTLASSSPLTFAGTLNETKTITINVAGDTVIETDETLSVTLGNVTAQTAVQSAAITSNATGNGTITNDDTQTLTISSPTIVEGNSGSLALVFTVTSSKAVQGGFTVPFTALNGTATSASDYTLASSSPLTFAGTSNESKTITVTVLGDTVVEDNETLSVTLGNVTAPTAVQSAAIASGATGAGTISNDDATTVTIDNPSVTEGTGGSKTLTFTVTSSRAVQGGFTVPFALGNGTAVLGSDLTLPASATLSFAGTVGETQTIAVPIVTDAIIEADEKFTVTLGAAGNTTATQSSAISSGATGNGTITNDDTQTLTINSETIAEGNGGSQTIVFTVTSPSEVQGGFNLNFSTSGTASSASDYTLDSSSPLTFAGTLSETKTITVTVLGDAVVEADETLSLVLGAVTGPNPSAITSSATGNLTIENDDSSTLTIDSPTVTEGTGGSNVLIFTVTSSSAVQGGFTVPFTVSNGNATSGSDFSLNGPTSVSFAGTAGETRTITVQVTTDATIEPDESFSVTLGTPTGTSAEQIANITSGAVGIGTILNDDTTTTPTVSISDATLAENGGKMIFTVSLSSPVSTSVKVKYATSPGSATSSDFKATSGTITFAAGQTSRNITVSVTGDSTVELDETFLMKLSSLSSSNSSVVLGDATATGTIVNDDSSVAWVGNESAKENNGRIVFTVRLTKAVDVPTTVDFATSPGSAASGADFTATSGRLTFSPGQTSKTVTVRVNGDSVFEADETFTLALSNVQAAGRSVSASATPATGVILNDDKGPTVTLSISGSSLNENGGTRTVTAKLDKQSAVDVVVTLGFSGSATQGTDYDASNTTITIPAGQLTAAITLTGLNDQLFEENENIVVDIVSVSGATESGTQRVTAAINESLNATAQVQSDPLSGGNALYVYGTSGKDSIVITRSNSDPNTYSVKINSQAPVSFGSSGDPLSRIYVFGGAGDDTIDVGTATALDAYVVGGSGNDKVYGGLGNDVLVGEAGNDLLTGRQGRDFLIGGLGLDSLIGELSAGSGGDQNLLIGNTLTYGSDFEALDALMDEWTSSDSFETRWQNLAAGSGIAGGRRLNISTVLNDGTVDQVYGGAASDWFLDFESSSSRKDKNNRTSIDRLN